MDETEPKREAPKVFDITSPQKVQPSSSSRPVVITNRPMIARDPMMKAAAPVIKDAPAPSQRTAIKIQPSEDMSETSISPVALATPVDVETATPSASEVPAQPDVPKPKTDLQAALDESQEDVDMANLNISLEASTVIDPTPIHFDPPVGVTEPAAEAAAENPQLLHDTIAEDTPVENPYVVPNTPSSVPTKIDGVSNDIDPADEAILKEVVDAKHEVFVHEHEAHTIKQRKLNKMLVIDLIIVAVLLFIAIDLLIDSDILSSGAFQNIPHTHFFSHN